MPELLAVILAAGQGTRMKSAMPKVLHQVAGKAMVNHVIDAARAAGAGEIIAIVGHGADQLRRHFAEEPAISLIEQTPQLGSGHALQQALSRIQGRSGAVLVLNGDAPLVEPGALRGLIEAHAQGQAQVSFLASAVDNPERLGRVVRSDGGQVRIVEWADATPSEREIQDVNTGIYCFDAAWLASQLPKLTLSPKGEYYLTELVARAEKVCVVQAPDMASCVGVDTRRALADAEHAMQRRLRGRWMDDGVTFLAPESVFVDAASCLGRDTVVYPNTSILRSDVGQGCTIGPNSRIEDSRMGNGCVVRESVLESAVLEDAVEVGPFSHLRPGAHVESGAKLGNYVEIKNARIGRNTQIHHFSYTGDAEVGGSVNIGAGTITCNYDSETGVKSRTVIGDGASTGSDTLLVAPVTLGAGAMTGSGAVVTRDVPPDTLVVGIPAREVRKVKRKGGAA